MPVAHSYGPTKVATDAIPGARKQASETNTSTGATLKQTEANAWDKVGQVGAHVSSVFSKMAADEKEASDQTALLKAEVDLGKWENQRLYDPNTGALGVTGEEALPLPEQVGTEFEKVSGDIAATLSNDKQRAAFARVRANHALNLDGTLRVHVEKEITKYRAGVLQATVETATSTAISNALDPRRVGEELQKATDAIATLGPKVGLSKPQLEVATRKAQTAIHSGVIERLLENDNDKGARAYFEETKSQIDGDAIANIEKALDEGTLRGSSQKKADEIVTAGGTLTAQLEKVRAIDDPKLRDAVRERVEHEANINERAKQDAEEKASGDAFNIIDKTHNIASIPPAMWANFSGSTKSSLRSYAEHLVKGVPVETDDQTFYALMEQAGTDPKTFLTQNLLDYRGKLSDGDFQQLTGLKLSLRNGDRNASEKALGGFRTKSEIIDNTLTQYGIDPKDKAMAPAVAQLQRMLDQRIETAQANGQKVTNVEIQQTVDELLSQGETVPGSWLALVRPFTYDLAEKKKKLIEMQPGDIPAATRKDIETRLRAKGRPISDATVLATYIEMSIK